MPGLSDAETLSNRRSRLPRGTLHWEAPPHVSPVVMDRFSPILDHRLRSKVHSCRWERVS